MVVAELIEKLQKHDPAKKVLIPRYGRFVEPDIVHAVTVYDMKQDYRTEYHISGPWRPKHLDTIEAATIE